jgi:uncharacterized protein YndB with AHSA1/START domain
MQTVTVTRTIPASPERVFDVLSNHADYKSFPGVKDSWLQQEGRPEKNGVGAVRHIVTQGIWFDEEITHYDRPRRFDYRIVRSNIPLEHQGGSVRLEPAAGGGTAVTWTTVMRVKLPLLGGVLTKLAGGKLGQAFGGMLRETERRLAA